MALRSKTRSGTTITNPDAGARWVGSIRISQVGGREGEAFMSPTDQRKAIEARAATGGATIVAWFEEHDVSGGSTDRDGLNAAVEMVLSGRADGLIVAKVDRFARTLEGGLQTIRLLRKAGKRFIAVGENVDSGRDDPMSNLIMHLMLVLAEWQLNQLTLGWEKTRQNHVESGIANGCPFGYRKDAQRRLTPDPELAPWVVHIFTSRAAGKSYTAIADDLTARGVPTPSRVMHERWLADGRVGKEPPRGGDCWLTQQIRMMLARRTYLGELRSGDPDSADASAGFLNDEAHPPIISADLWLRVQRTAKTPAKLDRPSSLLAGIARCASCGMRMAMMANRVAGGNRVKVATTYRYYRCTREHSWGKCPGPVAIRGDHLEAYVLDAFEAQYVGDLASTDATDLELIEAGGALLEATARAKAFFGLPSTAALRLLDDDDLIATAQAPFLEAIAEAKLRVQELRQRGVIAQLPTDLHSEWPAIRAEVERGITENSERVRHLLAMVYPAVAVWPGDRSVPVDDRVRLFNPDTVPVDLPGRAEGVVAHCRPIVERAT